MAARWLVWSLSALPWNVLIMLGNAALAPTTVLASQRRPDHAGDTKVGFVKLPSRNQVVDDGFLLGDPIHLGHEPGVVRHAPDVEPRREADEDGTEKVDKIGLIWGLLVPWHFGLRLMRDSLGPALALAVNANKVVIQFRPQKKSDAANMPDIQGCSGQHFPLIRRQVTHRPLKRPHVWWRIGDHLPTHPLNRVDNEKGKRNAGIDGHP